MLLYSISGPVELPDTRVTHAVSMIAVGLKFHENGTLITQEKHGMVVKKHKQFCPSVN